MMLENDQSDIVFRTAAVTVVILGLYASSLYSYILFHSLIEFSTIAIAFTLFILTWNARRFLTGGCLKALGIGYGLIALIDLLHGLAYKGMGIFPGYDANLPTQLWIAARALQAVLLCLSPLFARRNLDERVFFVISFAVVSVSTALVYLGAFPDCFIEGTGLTPFKIVSEYVISALLIVALLLFIGARAAFNTRVFALIVVGILCTIASELAFTSYLSVYGPANMAGHFLKLAAFYLIYRALVVTGFQVPFDLIFRDLKLAEQALTREKEFSHGLLESMADGVVACDADGILALFNRSAREWHGLDPMKLPSEEWAQHYDLYRSDGISPLPTDEIPLARAFRGEIVRDAGMAIKAKGQPIRFILANGSMIQDQAGQKLGAVVVMRDITEFGHLEQELRKANDELELRVEKRTEELRRTARDLNEAQRIAHVGSWELNLLTNQLSWSDEIYRMFEIDPRAFGASYEAFLQVVHPDDREAVNAAYTYSVRTRTPYSIDHRLLLPEGRIKHVHERCETFYDNDKPIRSVGTVQDVTELKRSEEERLAHLWFMESMDAINREIQGVNDLERMMSNVLDVVLSIFKCDRAFLLYPCDPESETWSTPMERNKPEYPGVRELGIEMPMDHDVAETFRILIAADGPVKFGPGTSRAVPSGVAERFGVKCFMSMAIYPNVGKPWQFGIHQCSHARVWTIEEEHLFQETGRRLADSMASLLMYRDLHRSEERYRMVFEDSPISIWEEDFSEVRTFFDRLKKEGVTDIEQYLYDHPDAVRHCVEQTKVIDVNRAALTLHGAVSKEELFSGLVNTFTPESFDTFRQELVCLWNGGTEMVRDAVVKTLAGESRHVTVYFSVCPDYEGTLAKILVSLADISSRKQAEEAVMKLNEELEQRVKERTFALEESQRALMNIVEDLNLKTEELERANSKLQELDRLKSMFIASMSHELRTPLNSIIGFSSIIRDEWLGPVNPEQKENLEIVLRSGKHLLSLINDVIDVSKIEAGKIESRYEEFDLYDLLTEAVQYVEKDLRDKGLELRLAIDHHQLFTDKRRLLQCVINLLSNAVKFTEHGGVNVSSAVSDIRQKVAEPRPSGMPIQLIDISIQDSGIGIPAEDIPRLFNAFVRLESPLKTTVPGTGLGLYLTRKLVVEVLHGGILCNSTVGTGSTFTLKIPERINEKGTGSRG